MSTGSAPSLEGGRELVRSWGRQKRLALLVDTFANYFDLADLSPTEADVAVGPTMVAIELFKRRRRDAFFAGGINYQGGDAYNDIVIDFHLAAIWRVRGWDSSSLPDDVRGHLANPFQVPVGDTPVGKAGQVRGT